MTVMDAVQREFDAARERYRRAYDRGYVLAQRGDDVRAQKVLDHANAEYEAAKAKYDAARATSS